MATLIIRGGKTISGTHRISGNKNAVLPMIAAALLTPEPVTLENVPEIADVASMLEAAKSFGAKVTRDLAAGSVTIVAAKLKTANGANLILSGSCSGGSTSRTYRLCATLTTRSPRLGSCRVRRTGWTASARTPSKRSSRTSTC